MYSEVTVQSHNSERKLDIKNPYTYNREYTDALTESLYLRGRYYDLNHGVFLTQEHYLDSLLEPFGQNRNTYTENNRVNYTEPSGHGVYGKIKPIDKKTLKAQFSVHITWASQNLSGFTKKHFCTTANHIKKAYLQFINNIDWKKVAITGVAILYPL